MRRVADHLNTLFDDPGVIDAVHARRVLRAWPSVVGDILARQTRSLDYEHGTLLISMNGSAWNQEIKLRQEMILEKLNELQTGGPRFRRIRIVER